MIKTSSRVSFAIILALFAGVLLLHGSNAFPTIGSSRTTTTTARTTARFLTPQQAAELVQASRSLYHEDDDEEDDDNNNHNIKFPQPTGVEKQRSLVRRTFSLPSSLWHPHARAEGVAAAAAPSLVHPEPTTVAVTVDGRKALNNIATVTQNHKNNNHHYEDDVTGSKQDVVYFPIVGFTFVTDAPEHSRPLPGLTNPSCRLHSDKEVLYGCFHPKPKATNKKMP
ncbi:hypothetical protein ACA910_009832 [Epithemia clementina (nom. ined.)]